jgi:tetratricopeptide (TPR) repeat protein
LKHENEAIAAWKKATDLDRQQFSTEAQLAYALAAQGDREEAVERFKYVITHDHTLTPKQRYRYQREVHWLDKRWTLYLGESVRLDRSERGCRNGRRHTPVSAGESVLYDGSFIARGTYRPWSVPVDLVAQVVSNNVDFSDALQFSGGIRYQPLQQHAIYLSIETLADTARCTRADTMLRFNGSFFDGYDYTFETLPTWRHQLAFDMVYFIASHRRIGWMGYDVRPIVYRTARSTWQPYATLGAAFNDDNAKRKGITRLDGGVGLAVTLYGAWQEDSAHRFIVRTKIEARGKIAGNADDAKAVKWYLEWLF